MIHRKLSSEVTIRAGPDSAFCETSDLESVPAARLCNIQRIGRQYREEAVKCSFHRYDSNHRQYCKTAIRKTDTRVAQFPRRLPFPSIWRRPRNHAGEPKEPSIYSNSPDKSDSADYQRHTEHKMKVNHELWGNRVLQPTCINRTEQAGISHQPARCARYIQ